MHLLLITLTFADEGAAASDAEPADGALVVEGERGDAADPMDTSSNVTVIHVDEALSAQADVADVVDSATGTTVTRLGGLGAYSAVSIRGSTSQQVQVYLDGIPLNPDGAGSVNLGELPLSAFERVEIYRGNAPPRFGASPIGGVVNLVTGDPSGASLRAGGGSFGTATVGGRGGGAVGERGDVLLLVDGFHTLGDFTYFSDNGTEFNLRDDSRPTRQNNQTTQLGAHLRLRTELGAWQLSALNAGLLRSEGVAGHQNAQTTNVGLETRRNLLTGQAVWSPGTVRVTGRGWHHLRWEHFDDRGGEIGQGNQLQTQRMDSVGGLVDVAALPASWVIPAATLSVRRDAARIEDEIHDSTLERSRWVMSGAASAQVLLLQERVVVSPVVQATRLDPGDQDPTTYATGRLGLLVRPIDAVALKANGGRYLRPPALDELYGDRGTRVGNPELTPEIGWSWDVGGRVEIPRNDWVNGSVDAGHFWTWSWDRIVYFQNSQRTAIPLNAGETWVQGLELAVSLDVLGVVDSSSNLTRLVSVNLNPNAPYADKALPYLPALEFNQRTSVHWDERVRLGHTWSYTSPTSFDQANVYWSAPRSIHGAFVRIQPTPAWPSAELSVQNLTDRQVQVVDRDPFNPDPADRVVKPLTDFIGYPLPGRTLLLTVRWDA